MSAGEIAGLIAAVAFVLLVGAIAIPLWKLGRVLDEATKLVGGVTERTLPLLSEVTTTVEHTNNQLERVDTITTNVEQMSTNVSALTSLFAATLGSPVVKVAAFTYGVRRAVGERRRGEVTKRVREEMKAEKRAAGNGGARVSRVRRGRTLRRGRAGASE